MAKEKTIIIRKEIGGEIRGSLRNFLICSWSETYGPELGETTLRKMLDELGDETLGGVLPNNDETLLVAYDESNIVGSCVYATRHGVTYIWGCYVSKKFQRSGVASSMINVIFSRTKRPMTYQLTVLKSSKAAVSFYENIGFRNTSEETFEIIPGNYQEACTMTISQN